MPPKLNEQPRQPNADHDAASWVDLYGDDLYRFALARVSDREIAQDLVQETFLAAIEAIDNFKRRSSIRTWLIAILKHKIVDHFRQRVRAPVAEQPDELAQMHEDLFTVKGRWKIKPDKWALNPFKIYEQKEFMDVLYCCLAKLPERMARVFMLREIDELSTDEICKALNITPTNSWVILYRARLLLRRCLTTHWLNSTK